MIQAELRSAGFEDMLAAGVVLTGGSSLVDGAVELAEEVTDQSAARLTWVLPPRQLPSRQVIEELYREKGYYFATVTVDEGERKIMDKVREKADQRVLIKPAEGVALQDTVRVLDRLSAAGVANMSFVRSGSR